MEMSREMVGRDLVLRFDNFVALLVILHFHSLTQLKNQRHEWRESVFTWISGMHLILTEHQHLIDTRLYLRNPGTHIGEN